MTPMFLVLVAIAPAIVLLLRPRIVVTMLLTILATWAASTLAIVLLGSIEDITLAILAMVVVVPAVLVGMAIVVATCLAPGPRRISDAGFLAFAGAWIGFLVTLFIGLDLARAAALGELMIITLIPSAYAGAGAAFGATNPRT